MADVTKGGSVVTDWTAVAQNTVVHSDELALTDDLSAILLLQAFLDTTTAHTGTEIITEISWNTSGDEDWTELTKRVILIGTAATDLIEDNPLAASSTAIALTGHALTVLSKLLAIEDGTLANSEIVREKSQTANEVVILDGTTNAHVQNTAIFNVAISENIASLEAAIRRVRIVVNNAYDPDGSTLNYRLMVSRATDIG
jgi:hypothetical protein